MLTFDRKQQNSVKQLSINQKINLKKKERTYVYLRLIHVGVWQKPTQHCKAVILQLKINNLFFFKKKKEKINKKSPNLCYSLQSESVSSSVMSNSLRPRGLLPTRLLCPWDSPGRNTRVSSHSLLQGIFSIQGLNPGLPHYRQIFYHPSHPGSLAAQTIKMQG